MSSPFQCASSRQTCHGYLLHNVAFLDCYLFLITSVFLVVARFLYHAQSVRAYKIFRRVAIVWFLVELFWFVWSSFYLIPSSPLCGGPEEDEDGNLISEDESGIVFIGLFATRMTWLSSTVYTLVLQRTRLDDVVDNTEVCEAIGYRREYFGGSKALLGPLNPMSKSMVHVPISATALCFPLVMLFAMLSLSDMHRVVPEEYNSNCNGWFVGFVCLTLSFALLSFLESVVTRFIRPLGWLYKLLHYGYPLLNLAWGFFGVFYTSYVPVVEFPAELELPDVCGNSTMFTTVFGAVNVLIVGIGLTHVMIGMMSGKPWNDWKIMCNVYTRLGNLHKISRGVEGVGIEDGVVLVVLAPVLAPGNNQVGEIEVPRFPTKFPTFLRMYLFVFQAVVMFFAYKDASCNQPGTFGYTWMLFEAVVLPVVYGLVYMIGGRQGSNPGARKWGGRAYLLIILVDISSKGFGMIAPSLFDPGYDGDSCSAGRYWFKQIPQAVFNFGFMILASQSQKQHPSEFVSFTRWWNFNSIGDPITLVAANHVEPIGELFVVFVFTGVASLALSVPRLLYA